MLIKVLFSLIIVIFIMYILAFIIKKIQQKQIRVGNNNRLQFIEALHIDQHTKLVLLEKDHEEILLVIGKNDNHVINMNNNRK